MATITAAFLAVWVIGLLITVSADNRRSGDTTRTALETLVQQQAATIQTLQARLDAQDATIAGLQNTQQHQGSLIHTIQTTPRKTSGFLADMYNHQPSDDITIPTGDSVKFNNIIENMGHAYDNVTGTFTVPYDGLYIFDLQFMGGLHGSYTQLGIYSGNILHASAYADGDNTAQGSATAILHLPQGREVTVKVSGGDGQIRGSTFTSFSGALLHAFKIA